MMGVLDFKFYCCILNMIDVVVSGEFVIVYNVFVSYVEKCLDLDVFIIILLLDFLIVMLCIMLILMILINFDFVEVFLDFVLG